MLSCFGSPVAWHTRSRTRSAEQPEPQAAQSSDSEPTPMASDPLPIIEAPVETAAPMDHEAPVAAASPQPTAREIQAADAARARLAAGAAAAPTATLPAAAKLPTGPEPVSTDVEYPSAAQLQPVDSPSQQLKVVMAQLESKDWMEVCAALTLARRLLAHHAPVFQQQPQSLAAFVSLVLKSVQNLRSSVSKTAIMCVAETFAAFGAAVLPYVDRGGVSQPATSLLHQLLLKAGSNDKRFVVEEAQRALTTFSETMPPAEVLTLLLPYVGHKNPKLRGQAARQLALAAQRAGPNQLQAFGADRLLKATGALVSDNTPEARNAARQLASLLQAAFAQQSGSMDSAHAIGKENAAAQTAAATHAPAGNVVKPWLKPAARSGLQNGSTGSQAKAASSRFGAIANGNGFGSSVHGGVFSNGVSPKKAAAAANGSPVKSAGASPTKMSGSPSKAAPVTWEAHCRALLPGSTAAAVLRACK